MGREDDEAKVDGCRGAGREVGAGFGPADAAGGAEAAGGGVAAVTLRALFNSLPPDAPVSKSVVPTDTKKTKVYFFDESSIEERSFNGLDELGFDVGGEGDTSGVEPTHVELELISDIAV